MLTTYRTTHVIILLFSKFCIQTT